MLGEKLVFDDSRSLLLQIILFLLQLFFGFRWV